MSTLAERTEALILFYMRILQAINEAKDYMDDIVLIHQKRRGNNG